MTASHACTSLYDALEAREFGTRQLKSVSLLERHRHESLWQRDVKGHTGCVNALEFSPDEAFLLSGQCLKGGVECLGGDDCGVFLWRTYDLMLGEVGQMPKPLRVMKRRHFSNIFSVGFAADGRVGFSAGNDRVFIAHDLETGQDVYSLYGNDVFHRVDAHVSPHKSMHSLFQPTSENIVAVTCENGKVHIVDIRSKEETAYPVSCTAFSAVYNPQHPELLLIASRRDGLIVRDIRKPDQ